MMERTKGHEDRVEMERYQIIVAASALELTWAVNEYLKYGWKPMPGGFVVAFKTFHQVITR